MRPDPYAWISDEEDAALYRRSRALRAGLSDRSALVRNLALRIAKRIARANAARAALSNAHCGRRRFPPPPRALGALYALAPKPEPRPPDVSTTVPA